MNRHTTIISYLLLKSIRTFVLFGFHGLYQSTTNHFYLLLADTFLRQEDRSDIINRQSFCIFHPVFVSSFVDILQSCAHRSMVHHLDFQILLSVQLKFSFCHTITSFQCFQSHLYPGFQVPLLQSARFPAGALQF